MGEPTKQMSPKIRLHSLAPTRNLGDKDNQYRVYRNYLSQAFANQEMKNIALSGNLGAGKSSILHSFDKQRNGLEERFLYISLMDFEDYEKKCSCKDNLDQNTDMPCENTEESSNYEAQTTEDSMITLQTSEKDNKTAQKETKSKIDPRQETQKRVEYNLLCQILSYCKKRDLRNSSLRGVPEPPFSMLEALMVALLPVMVFVLVFRERFSLWATSLFVKQEILTGIHLWLYPLLGTLLFVLFFYMMRFGKLQKLSFNSDHATAEIAFSNTQTSLDLHKFELVHALIKLRKKIDYTVVFEDMDRIDPQICIAVMTKLRDLNLLVNTRLSRKTSFLSTYLFADYGIPNHVRFVYAVSEDVLDHELRTKFFDCIIPVVPALNQYNTELILRSELQKYEVDISGEKAGSVFVQIFPYLNDYRTVLTFCNELLILKELFKVDGESFSDRDDDTALLLEITFYKVLVPQKYARVFSEEGKGEFPEVVPEDLKDFQDDDYKKKLSELLNKLRPCNLDMEVLINSAEKAKVHWLEILNHQYLPRKRWLSECLSTYTKLSIADELKAGNIFDAERDTDVATNLAAHIQGNSKDLVEFKEWFFGMGEPSSFKFSNAIAFLSKNSGNRIEATEEPRALFNWCIDNLRCMVSTGELRNKWSDKVLQRKLVSLLLPYKDVISSNSEIGEKVLTDADTVNSLLDAEMRRRMDDDWWAELDDLFGHVDQAYEQVQERQNIDEAIEKSLENPEDMVDDIGSEKTDELPEHIDHAYEQVQKRQNIDEAIEKSLENPEDLDDENRPKELEESVEVGGLFNTVDQSCKQVKEQQSMDEAARACPENIGVDIAERPEATVTDDTNNPIAEE